MQKLEILQANALYKAVIPSLVLSLARYLDLINC